MHKARHLRLLGVQTWSLREQTRRADASPAPIDKPQESAAPASSRAASAPIDKPQESPTPVSSRAAPAPADIDVATLGWDELRQRVASCTACELCNGRTQTVFGVGNPQADWLIVGEAPGVEEDRRGEPFVGRAGMLLDAMLKAAGQARERVYIANILKCRPPNNRDPHQAEAHSCRPFLDRQIALLQPRLILAVGRVAAQHLLDSDRPVGKLRGAVHRYGAGGVPLVVTYHPAYLLRSPGQKRKAWEDLRRALTVTAGPHK